MGARGPIAIGSRVGLQVKDSNPDDGENVRSIRWLRWAPLALASAMHAQAPLVELPKRVLPRDDWSTASVCGDVDGDGDTDIVVAHHGIQLFMNFGNGGFVDATAARMPALSDYFGDLAIGDVDGDQDLDLVGASRDGRSRLLVNNGAGFFTDVSVPQMPGPSVDVADCVLLVDLDRDGDRDLLLGAAAGSGSTASRLYTNNGAGSFLDVTATHWIATNRAAGHATAGDVDGDGDIDLVLGLLDGLLINNGAGVMTAAPATHLPAPGPWFNRTTAVGLGDVDGDQDLDLVYGKQWSAQLCLNDGAGVFTDVSSSRLPSNNDRATGVLIADLDRDGDSDLVLGRMGQDCFYRNDGAGMFTDVTASQLPLDGDETGSLLAADFDGDNDLDLLIGNAGADRLYLNDGAGRFADATRPRLRHDRDWTSVIALGDIDQDGDLDVVTGSYGGYPDRVHRNDGSGVFVGRTDLPPVSGLETQALLLVDLDADRDLDIVAAGDYGSGAVFRNQGRGDFTVVPNAWPLATDHARGLAAGDVDGDGDPDLVVAVQGQRNRLYLNDGSGSFSDGTVIGLPPDTDDSNDVAFGDIDGDGDLDLAVGNGGTTAQQNRIYVNQGTGVFLHAPLALPVHLGITLDLEFVDVDGDGDLDLVTANGYFNSAGEQNRLLLNNGAGLFTDVTATNLPVDTDRTTSVGARDLDGDADADLVFLNGTQIAEPDLVLWNQGNGVFASGQPLTREPDRQNSLGIGDLDGDGDMDLVVGAEGYGNRLYFNLLRQLDAPDPLHVGRPYRLELHARGGPPRAADLALTVLSIAAVHVPVPPFGTLFIDPNLGVALPVISIPQPTGMAAVSLTVPNLPALAGMQLHAQAALLQHPFQHRLTNRVSDTLLR